DALAVSETEIHRGTGPRGLDGAVLEASPVADDLLQAIAAVVVVARSEFLNAGFPEFGGARILPAILEDLRQAFEGFVADTRRAGFAEFFIDAEEVEFVGKGQPPGPGG